MKRIFTLFLVFFFLWISGCAFKKVPSSPSNFRTDLPKTSKVEPEARTLFFQAERQYFLKNHDQAAKLYQQTKTKFPKGRAHGLSSYRLGSIYYYQGDYTAAVKEFEYYLNKYPNGDLSFDVTYNLAAAEHQLEHYDRAYQILSRLKLNDVQAQGPKRAEIIYQLTAQVSVSLGNYSGAISAYAAQMQLPQSEAVRHNIEENIDAALPKITSLAELGKLSTDITEPSTKNKIAKRMATFNSPSSPVSVSPLPSSTISSYPVIPPPSNAPLTSDSIGDKMNIGVVLPLTGKFASYGKRALEGILLAANIFSSTNPSSHRILIEDSAGNPAIARNAVDSLYKNSNVIAIIGPLNWKESISTSERAQELGLLNISLSGKEGISERGAYLFQNALTPRVQLENMVQFCVKEKGLKRFAIIAPRNSFGQDMTNEFWEAVEKNGAHVVAHETYGADDKDFQIYIQNLTGVSNPKYRKMEWSKLQEYLSEKKTAGKKESKLKLQPLIDFDAIFIPDSPKTVATIAANLAYFDVTGIPLLGTTEWNSDQLYKRGGKYVEGAIFPGGINLGTKNKNQKEFIKRYYDAYGSTPDLLATQAYEAMQLLSAAIQRSGSANRNDLVTHLAGLGDFEGPLGTLSFGPTRIAKRTLPVYILEAGGNIIEQ